MQAGDLSGNLWVSAGTDGEAKREVAATKRESSLRFDGFHRMLVRPTQGSLAWHLNWITY